MSSVKEIVFFIGLVISVILGYLAYNERTKDNSNLYQLVPAVLYNVKIQSKNVQSTSSTGSITIVNNNTQYDLYNQYKYTVDGKGYTGEYLNGSYNSYLIVQNEINNRMANKNINVYYEIANPSRSVLNYSRNNLIAYAAGAVIVLILSLLNGIDELSIIILFNLHKK
jgi:hypothetical protein